jgi:hypothetical protein
MNRPKTEKCGCVVLLVFVLLCMGAAAGLCYAGGAGTKNSSSGVLKLEGKQVDYIVLQRKDGHVEQITRPSETIKLPPGEYRLQEIRLKGGYTCNSLSGGRITVKADAEHLGVVNETLRIGAEPITVRAGRQEVLKVGAPLVPMVKVQRQGRILLLDYNLQGVGGESYIGGDRSKPPTFAVYKGQKQIASGQFEYG